jgi:hypothetical protein
VGVRVAVVSACLLLCGCTSSPPYVNPLKVEQLEALRISEIRFKYVKDGSIDAEKTAKAAELVRKRLIERLGSKLAPGKGNAALVVSLQLLFNQGPWAHIPGEVHIRGTAKILGKNFLAEYHFGSRSASPVFPLPKTAVEMVSPEKFLGSLATSAADSLTNQILCCCLRGSHQEPQIIPTCRLGDVNHA